MKGMKIASSEAPADPETVKTGKVKRSLALKAQPLIAKAATTSGIKRDLIQSALLRNLEHAGVRIGVATVARLLQDPKALVDGYLKRLVIEEAERVGNFERTLKQMLQNSAKLFAVEAFAEIRTRFPQSRDFRAMNMVGRLCAENQGRPLTLVPLPLDVVPATASRLVEGVLVVKDGEAVAWKKGVAIGPAEPKELAAEYASVWKGSLLEDSELTVVKAPGKSQLTFDLE
jgi:hypothetical protein